MRHLYDKCLVFLQLRDLIFWPCDLFLCNCFPSFQLNNAKVVYTSEDLAEEYHEIFEQCQVLFKLATIQKESQCKYIKRILLVEQSSKFHCNPLSRTIVVSRELLNLIPSSRRYYYLCFFLIFCDTIFRVVGAHPWLYIGALRRVQKAALRRALVFFKKVDFTPYDGDFLKLGFITEGL
jgi:hypothetical protein